MLNIIKEFFKKDEAMKPLHVDYDKVETLGDVILILRNVFPNIQMTEGTAITKGMEHLVIDREKLKEESDD